LYALLRFAELQTCIKLLSRIQAGYYIGNKTKQICRTGNVAETRRIK